MPRPSANPAEVPIRGSGPLQPSLYSDSPASNMRKVISKRLTQSKSTVPHFYTFKEISLDNILALRKVLAKDFDTSSTSTSTAGGRGRSTQQPTNERRNGGGGSAAEAQSATAAGDGRGEGKGDRRRDGNATATECAMVTRWRQKAIPGTSIP